MNQIQFGKKGWIPDRIETLNGKTFVITGTTSGTGFEAARILLKKGAKVDAAKHCVIKSPHPSPLSAHRGFFGSRPFSLANRYLIEHGKTPVDWSLEVELETGKS